MNWLFINFVHSAKHNHRWKVIQIQTDDKKPSERTRRKKLLNVKSSLVASLCPSK